MQPAAGYYRFGAEGPYAGRRLVLDSGAKHLRLVAAPTKRVAPPKLSRDSINHVTMPDLRADDVLEVEKVMIQNLEDQLRENNDGVVDITDRMMLDAAKEDLAKREAESTHYAFSNQAPGSLKADTLSFSIVDGVPVIQHVEIDDHIQDDRELLPQEKVSVLLEMEDRLIQHYGSKTAIPEDQATLLEQAWTDLETSLIDAPIMEGKTLEELVKQMVTDSLTAEQDIREFFTELTRDIYEMREDNSGKWRHRPYQWAFQMGLYFTSGEFKSEEEKVIHAGENFKKADITIKTLDVLQGIAWTIAIPPLGWITLCRAIGCCFLKPPDVVGQKLESLRIGGLEKQQGEVTELFEDAISTSMRLSQLLKDRFATQPEG